MASIESLIETNYNRINNKDCKEAVIKFIKETPTVIDRDITFIKRLTKVAYHVIQADKSSLDSLLERIYQFTSEGLSKIDPEINTLTESNLYTIKSHLSNYAGGFAKILYEKNKDKCWGEKAYKNYIKAASMNMDKDQNLSAHSYKSAAMVAESLFKETEEIYWAVRWYECARLAAEIGLNVDKMEAAVNYRSMGDAAKTMFDLTDDKKWLEIEINAYEQSAEYAKCTDSFFFAKSYLYAAIASNFAFRKLDNRNRELARRSIDSYNKFLDYCNKNPLRIFNTDEITRARQNVYRLQRAIVRGY